MADPDDDVDFCLSRADEARQRASKAENELDRTRYLEMEKTWLELANRFEAMQFLKKKTGRA